MSHTGSVKSGCCGRPGRSPPTIFEIAIADLNSPNGCLPVKTLRFECQANRHNLSTYTWQRAQGILRTNLYHNHAEGKDIRFSCIFITCFNNFRRGPPGSISLYRGQVDRV